jgi:hypothetical protein
MPDHLLRLPHLLRWGEMSQQAVREVRSEKSLEWESTLAGRA